MVELLVKAPYFHAMPPTKSITLSTILSAFWGRISVTWAIVLLENFLLAMIPLLIGLAIDGLLAGRVDELLLMGGVLVALGCVAVGRRVYDTRVYSAIRLRLGSRLVDNHPELKISAQNARLDMSRELVDFLEEDVPALITAIIQIIVSLVILAMFDLYLGLSSVIIVLAMLGFYALFHRHFFGLNAKMNAQTEKQVDILEGRSRLSIFRHLRAIRGAEVAISDTEAILYGGIFLLQIGYILFNLYHGAGLPEISAGRIFSIATYSWEYVEAALMLPIALQGWSRLSETTERINKAQES